MFDEMFDERDEKWIRIFKGGAIAFFWLEIIAAVVLGILGWCDCIWITEEPFLDGLILLVGGICVAFGHLVINMLIVQFLNNVNVIRQKIDELKIVPTLQDAPTCSPNDKNRGSIEMKGTYGQNGSMWTCKCGKVHPVYLSSCECGISLREIKAEKAQNNQKPGNNNSSPQKTR